MKFFRWILVALLIGAPAAGQDTSASSAGDLLVRYDYQGRVAFGRVEGDVVRELPGSDIFTAAVNVPTGRSYPLSSVRVLPPLDPDQVQKVLGVSLNTRRAGRTTPVEHPRWYLKLPTALNRDDGEIEMPGDSRNLTYAGGLVLIIGREGRNISVGEAPDFVWGVTIGNEISDISWVGERGGVREPGRVVGRSTDGWAPIGPFVARSIDYSAISIETRLNGDVVQAGTALDLVNDAASLISNISRYITLKPGDLIFTGTMPFREGARRVLQTGDQLEVEIEGIGILSNRVIPTNTSGGRP